MDYAQLAELEHLRSLGSQREFAKLVSKEADLRRQLDAIRAFRTDLHAPDPSLGSMRGIGADILWNRWLDQTQTTLNRSLARVLAQKEAMAKRVRKDVGRSETVKDLRLMHDKETTQAEKKAMLEKLMILAVQQSVHRSR